MKAEEMKIKRIERHQIKTIREKEVIILKVAYDYNFVEIGKKLGISKTKGAPNNGLWLA
jgi:hypothetical protein